MSAHDFLLRSAFDDIIMRKEKIIGSIFFCCFVFISWLTRLSINANLMLIFIIPNAIFPPQSFVFQRFNFLSYLDLTALFIYLGKPSRVIHIRNIPNEASDAEVINLGLQFGRVTNVLVLKGKNQAFLEMADEVSATAMVSVFNTTPPTVRGRTVYVQFSNHRELKTDQNHSITVRASFISLQSR